MISLDRDDALLVLRPHFTPGKPVPSLEKDVPIYEDYRATQLRWIDFASDSDFIHAPYDA